ncbi:MAG: class I SAM-dependent methyltransferase [Lachnoclostridium sp.]|nr:class I SAM-dependent methyltransferase [Lachnospira sp.]MCM1247584.1 class I SAM-dependent methyltransferase [Lachnoclostridium sp.]MCM1534864.1 class I SAM-dependent methyltransferase [Clostridium sp.]
MEIGKKVRISRRLQAICHMVTPGNSVVDVGCDHGFASIYLVQENLSPGVIAMDVRQGPLRSAAEHIRQYGLEDYIETRLSDGLSAYEAGEARSLICAGMGGRLMQKILTQGQEKARVLEELILQPQSELMEFRRFLRQSGYWILAEDILREEGKYYFLMKAVYRGDFNRGEESYGERKSQGSGMLSETELSDRYGGLLLRARHPVLKQYLETCLETKCRIAETLRGNESSKAGRKLDEVQAEIQYLRQALMLYQQ